MTAGVSALLLLIPACFLQLLTITADNASNNGTLISTIGRLIFQADPSIWWDNDRATIRCLPHVVHLAVMALLVGVKAIKPDTPLDSAIIDDLTTAEAEDIVAMENTESSEEDSSTVPDRSVDLMSAIENVSRLSHSSITKFLKSL